MKAAGLLGIVLALGAAFYLYNAQLTRGSAGTASPQEQIDVTGIRMALLEIAQAERIYVAGHGTYGTFEQLRADGAPAVGTDRRGYTFQLELNGSQVDSKRPRRRQTRTSRAGPRCRSTRACRLPSADDLNPEARDMADES